MHLDNLTVISLSELCGSMLVFYPDTAFTFALDLSAYEAKGVVAAHLICAEQGSEAPLTADNAGFLPFALSWLARERAAITVTITTQALFWVHVRRAKND